MHTDSGRDLARIATLVASRTGREGSASAPGASSRESGS